jgi:phage/plasmid-associated DNA primase
VCQSYRLRFYGKWHFWNGKRFEVDGTGSFVRFVIMHQLSRVYQRVRDELHEQLKSAGADKERAAELLAMLKSLRNYNNVAAVNSTMDVMQGELYAPDLFERLNTDVHIINVRNSIWQLKTGALDLHRPQYLCFYMTDVDYRVNRRQRRMIQGWGG